MKYMMRIALLLILAAVLLTGCEKTQTPSQNEPIYYTVTFDANGGSAVAQKKVLAGQKLSAPEDPIRENYIFDGWYQGNQEWVFSLSNVTGDMTLRAAWKSSDDVFGYVTKEGTDEALLSSLKSTHPTLLLPTSINGFRVVGIADGAFEELSSDHVSRIIVPETIVEIGEDAFAGCEGIAIELRGALQSVGERAFFGCDGLSAVSFAEGMTRVTCDAFAESGIRSLILPSTIKTIEEGAFQGCAALGTVVVHGTLAATDAPYAVEDSAFRECTALATVFLYGTEAEKTAILDRTAGINDPFCEAAFCYYSAEEPTTEGDFWYMNNGKPRIW